MGTFWNRIQSLLKGSKPTPVNPSGKSCCAHAKQAPPPRDYPKGKAIRRVFIVEGCLVCNACEVECPEVFRLDGSKPVAIQAAEVLPDSERYFITHRDQIERTAAQCHVGVIGIEYTDGTFSPLGTAHGPAASVAPVLPDVPLNFLQD